MKKSDTVVTEYVEFCLICGKPYNIEGHHLICGKGRRQKRNGGQAAPACM
ncbi:hypothetical protein [Mediterraneibacter gnavus]|nr:hypothetical protein [Mediterraneibacter gnavus]